MDANDVADSKSLLRLLDVYMDQRRPRHARGHSKPAKGRGRYVVFWQFEPGVLTVARVRSKRHARALTRLHRDRGARWHRWHRRDWPNLRPMASNWEAARDMWGAMRFLVRKLKVGTTGNAL